jgi:hypothetical protein
MTSLLQSLGLIDAPEGTTLQGAEFALRGMFPLWLAILIFLLGVAGAAWFYSRESGKLGTGTRVILGGLRVLLIALVLLLIMRPVLLATFKGERPRPVLILVDTSQSMSIADRRVSDRDLLNVAIANGEAAYDADPSALKALDKSKLANVPRIDIVKAALGNHELALLDKLGKKGPVKVMLFDRRGEPAGEDWAEKLKAEGSQTALADTVFAALSRQEGELPAAIVVISDGRDTASTHTLEEVGRACGARGVPLHIWGVGSSEAGVLELKDVQVPRTVFIDEKEDIKDDPIEVPVRFRCRGFKKGTIVLTLQVGDETVTEEMPVTEGENLIKVLRLEPKKGKEGERKVKVSAHLKERPEVRADEDRVVQVKNSRIKVLYLEDRPRREYKFIHPVLNRDRRILLRVMLVEGDPDLEKEGVDRESGARYITKFPDKFPDPDDKDPDRRPYDLVILGDVPLTALGDNGPKALQKWVKEGGGIAFLAGKAHMPAEYAGSDLAEVLPVEFKREEFTVADALKAQPYKPKLTYDGEQSLLLALHDKTEDNLKLWKEDLWKYVPGFFWYYPVGELRSGAVALLVHPEKKVGKPTEEKPMPLIATQYYGKGDVLYIGVEETWRWRDNTGDKLTARFWGQAALQLGLPHLLGNARRSQLEMERNEPVLGRQGAVKARLLDPKYEPVRRREVRAQLVNLDAKEEAHRTREVPLTAIPGQPGEYRGALPNDVAGRHELRLPGLDGIEETVLPFRVELPPRHELLQAGLADDALTGMALSSGGRFYRENDLHEMPDTVKAVPHPYEQRQEVLLWGPLAMALFVLLITAEWLLRKASNLS